MASHVRMKWIVRISAVVLIAIAAVATYEYISFNRDMRELGEGLNELGEGLGELGDGLGRLSLTSNSATDTTQEVLSEPRDTVRGN